MRLEIIQNNYLYVPSFIEHNETIKLLKELKEYCTKFKPTDLTDPSCHVSASYNWLPFVRLMVEKTNKVSELLGETVLPTYTYYRWQSTGHTLPRHRDRPSCEISLSLNLYQDKPWGFWIQKPNKKEVEVVLNPGDAIMYLGCQADHWRNTFEGNENIQVFLHYVRAYGPKAWAYFDKQRQQDPTAPIDSIPNTFL